MGVTNTAIIVSFCKHCGDDFAGLVPTSITKLLKRFSISAPTSSTGIGPDKQRVVKNVLVEYHSILSNSLLNVHKVGVFGSITSYKAVYEFKPKPFLIGLISCSQYFPLTQSCECVALVKCPAAASMSAAGFARLTGLGLKVHL